MNFIINCKEWSEKTYHLQGKIKWIILAYWNIFSFMYRSGQTFLLLHIVKTFWTKENNIMSLQRWWLEWKFYAQTKFSEKTCKSYHPPKMFFFLLWISTYVILYGWVQNEYYLRLLKYRTILLMINKIQFYFLVNL